MRRHLLLESRETSSGALPAAGRRVLRYVVSTSTYRRYVAAVLTLVYTFSQVDQSLMGVALQPLQHDLKLSDAQIGLVTGIVFGLFYATLGIPVGRWADSGNRSTIAALAVALWGVSVASCTFVTAFAQLMMVRVAAAIAASACIPPTYSLLGDYFPRTTERMRAMSLYSMANPLSGVVAYMVGGWLTGHFGWRAAFLVMGVPGLVLAVLLKLTVSEVRVIAHQEEASVAFNSGVIEALRLLWRRPSSRHLGIGIILVYTMGWGLNPWYAAFMIRSHGMGTVEVGMWLGVIFGLCGVGGIMLGGYVSSRWFSHSERAQMRLTAIMLAANVPLLCLFLLLPGAHAALAAFGLSLIVSTFFYGPAFTLMQRLSHPQMRATQWALIMLLANLIGMGVGTEAVGAVSDFLRPVAGQDSLRYGMLAVSLVGIWPSYHFWRVGRTVKVDLLADSLSADSRASCSAANGVGLLMAP